MPIETATATVCAFARGRKQQLLGDATHFLLIVRNERPVAVLECGDLNELLRLADTAAAGYGADAIAIVLEGVFPVVGMNPVTGRAWQRGEAEQLWLEHDGVEKGWVSESQFLAIALRTGETAHEGWRFRLVGDRVAWADAPQTLSRTGLADALAARIVKPIVDASRVPVPGEGFVGDAENGPFYDLERGRQALDIGCTRILGNQLLGRGEARLLVDDEAGARTLISAGLSSWQVDVVAARVPKD